MKTVLYGIGKRTQAYIEEHPNQDIYGILDGYRTEGIFCGKTIIPIEKLTDEEAKIIIIARKASESIIYKRIKDFCAKHHIPVYNADGRNLALERAVPDVDHIYFNKNKEELRHKIENYEAISFDIFDTLLTRKVGGAEEVFLFVQRNSSVNFDYVSERLKAEKMLSQIRVPKLEEIYRLMEENTGVSYKELSILMEKEILAEKEILVPRAEMIELFNHAVSMKKKVFLITDMYFSETIINQILKRFHIENFTGLLVSSEYKTDKSKELYRIYVEKAQSNSMLHIGDMDFQDGTCAEKFGLSTYLVKSPEEMFDLTKAGYVLGHDLPAFAGMMRNLTLSRLFRNPFALYRSSGIIQIKHAYDLGYALLAPALLSYVLWLKERMGEDGIDVMMFLSRDGYLIKKVYDTVSCYEKGNGKNPSSIYLLVSRGLVVAASSDSEADIKSAIRMSFDGTPDDMLRKRFQLRENEIQPYYNFMEIDSYIMMHKELIYKRAREIKSNYVKYLGKFQLDDKKTAVFDFVSSGTCQMGLEKILEKPLYGYYFERIQDDSIQKKKLNIKSFVREAGSSTCDNYFFIEPLIKEICPSLKNINADGCPCYWDRHIEKEQAEHINRVQQGVLDYVNDYVKYCGKTSFDKEAAWFSIQVLKLINSDYVQWTGSRDAAGVNFDEFCNRSVKIIV